MRQDAVYIRKSSDPQEEESQKKGVRDYLADRRLPFPPASHWFTDTGSRHHSKTREDFQSMLRLVQQGKIGTVYCWHQDRIGTKDHFEWFHICYLFREHGSRIVEVTTGAELTSPDIATGVTTLVKAEGSREFQEKLGTNVLREMVDRAKRGQPQSKIPPYGYDKEYRTESGELLWRVHYQDNGKILVVMPDGSRVEREQPPRKNRTDTIRYVLSLAKERIATVKQIFEMYRTQAISPRGIAIKLNQQGKHRYGKGWSRTTVEYILSNPVYIGSIRYNRTSQGEFAHFNGKAISPTTNPDRKQRTNKGEAVILTPNVHEGIINPEVFALVQEKLKTKKERPSPLRREDTYLRGLLFCGKCGRAMHCFSARGKAGYICASYYRFSQDRSPQNDTGCTRNYISHEKAEALVLEHVGKMREDINNRPEDSALLRIREIDCTLGSIDLDQAISRGIRAYIAHLEEVFTTADDAAGMALCRKLVTVKGDIRDKRLAAELAKIGAGTPLGVDMVRRWFVMYEEQKVKAARAKVEKLQEEFEGWLLAKGRARTERELHTADNQLARIEADLARWEGLCVPLEDQLAELRAKLHGYRKQLQQTEDALKGSNKLRKAELLRSLLSKVVLHYRAVQKAKYRDCILERVEFVSNHPANSASPARRASWPAGRGCRSSAGSR
jgi:hypothetical protein